jgi:hypothetical protein
MKLKNSYWVIIGLIAVAIYYFFFRKKTMTGNGSSSKMANPVTTSNSIKSEESSSSPGLFTLAYEIATKGKDNVFPFVLEKATPDVMELPLRRSLLDQNAEYKYIDVAQGQKIKIVDLQYLTYAINSNVMVDNFLVTDNNYLISVYQAEHNFRKI